MEREIHTGRFAVGHKPFITARKKPVADRFWVKVDKSGGPEACWPWHGATTTQGYGRFSDDNKRLRQATHIAYELNHPGERVERRWILHSCDNPPCVNPSHLFLGDAFTNVHDMKQKGRSRHRSKGRPKWTAEDIREMRRLYSAGMSRKELVARFGMSPRQVNMVTSGRSWPNV